jgi:hypothetical protein
MTLISKNAEINQLNQKEEVNTNTATPVESDCHKLTLGRRKIIHQRQYS